MDFFIFLENINVFYLQLNSRYILDASSMLYFAVIELLCLVVFSISSVEAAAQVYFQTPIQFAGTGCQPDSYVVFGAGTETLSILFSGYDAANPPEKAASKLQRTACSFAVPVHVPSGYQLSVVTADWRGYAAGTTELFREYFFAGKEGVRKSSQPTSDYVERDDDLRYSSCGEDVLLRINSSVRADSADSYISVDSVDMQNGVLFHLHWEKCGPLALPAVLQLLL